MYMSQNTWIRDSSPASQTLMYIHVYVIVYVNVICTCKCNHNVACKINIYTRHPNAKKKIYTRITSWAVFQTT
jgi:hypothetical protein